MGTHLACRFRDRRASKELAYDQQSNVLGLC